MSYVNVEFAPCQYAYGAVGGDDFSTEVVVTASGYEARNQNWEKSRRSYDLATTRRTQVERNEIQAFFLTVAKGRAHSFPFWDYADHAIVAQAALLLTTTTFQLQNQYESGGSTLTRAITKTNGTVTVWANGVLQSSGFTVNPLTGIITFSGAPAVPVTASCEYYVPVRFDQDRLRWSAVDRSGSTLLYVCDQLNLVEVRGE